MWRSVARWAGLVGLVGVALGCRGEELARIALVKPGDTAQVTWTTSGATIAVVWSDFEGKWTGHEDDPGLVYDLELFEGATSVQKLACATSTCTSRVCSSTVSINGRHSGACECKTSCTIAAPKAATYTLRATVNAPGGTFTDAKNAALVLRK